MPKAPRNQTALDKSRKASSFGPDCRRQSCKGTCTGASAPAGPQHCSQVCPCRVRVSDVMEVLFCGQCIVCGNGSDGGPGVVLAERCTTSTTCRVGLCQACAGDKSDQEDVRCACGVRMTPVPLSRGVTLGVLQERRVCPCGHTMYRMVGSDARWDDSGHVCEQTVPGTSCPKLAECDARDVAAHVDGCCHSQCQSLKLAMKLYALDHEAKVEETLRELDDLRAAISAEQRYGDGEIIESSDRPLERRSDDHMNPGYEPTSPTYSPTSP